MAPPWSDQRPCSWACTAFWVASQAHPCLRSASVPLECLSATSSPASHSGCLRASIVSRCHLRPSFAFRLPQGLFSVSVPPQA
eukprot:1154255-Pelagomonas_calceolata.AAC.6